MWQGVEKAYLGISSKCHTQSTILEGNLAVFPLYKLKIREGTEIYSVLSNLPASLLRRGEDKTNKKTPETQIRGVATHHLRRTKDAGLQPSPKLCRSAVSKSATKSDLEYPHMQVSYLRSSLLFFGFKEDQKSQEVMKSYF